MICTDLLQFVAAKSNLCSTFYWFILTKNRNLGSLQYGFKHKIYTLFDISTQTYSPKKCIKLAVKMSSYQVKHNFKHELQ